MKITGTGRVGTPAASRSAGGGQGFSVGQPGPASEVAHLGPAGGVTGVSSIDALLALQSVGGPLERRRRAVSRAGRILDVLDEVKISILEGEATPYALERLMVALRGTRDDTEDAALEGVLDEIETRAAVELAKLEVSRRAA
jgi:hypothetical protein